MSMLRVGAQGVAWPPVWADGIDATISELTYRLRSVLGDVPGDATVGLPYYAWAASRPTAGEVVAAVRAQAEATTGVIRSLVTTSIGATSISVALEVVIAADGQTVTRTLATEVYAGLPSAWYLRAGV